MTSGGNTAGCSGEQRWVRLIFLFDSTHPQKALIRLNSWLTMASQDLIQINSRFKMDVWNLIQIDLQLKKLPEFWLKSVLDWKRFQNLDSNQLMTQWCYSFPVSFDLFGAFNFIVDSVWPFLGLLTQVPFWQIDLNQLMTQAVSRRHESIQLMTQVDSQVLIQIDSWLKMLPDFSIQINSLLKRKTFDSESTHDSTLSQTHAWRWAFRYFCNCVCTVSTDADCGELWQLKKYASIGENCIIKMG